MSHPRLAPDSRDGVRLGSLDPGDFAGFDRNFPFFGRPTELGSFSLDGERNYCNDSRNQQYYIAPSVEDPNFNLSDGYDRAMQRDFGKEEKLDSMLQWIAHNHQKVVAQDDTGQTRLAANFVCYRGLLTAIACTPYEDKNEWIILATKFRGTIYLCAVDTDDDIKRRNSMTHRDKLMSFWGYKFEQYVCSESPQKKPTPHLPLNVCEEYNIVCKSKLGEHRILYGAEIDCLDPDSASMTNTDRYVELKTNRVLTAFRQEQNFHRFKLLKWWLQSFLIGIPTIVCGFRNDAGFVKEIKTFKTSDLPKISKGVWKPSVCFNFCDEFLSFVAKYVEERHTNLTFIFRWRPRGNVTCERLQTPGEKFTILPDWYISQFKNLNE